jgi:hypothetical protein
MQERPPGSSSIATSGAPSRDPRAVGQDLRTLSSTFARISVALVQAGQRMQTHGVPIDAELLAEASSSYRTFQSLKEETLGKATEYEVAAAGDSALFAGAGLLELIALVDRAAEIHERRPEREFALRQALTLVDRVLTMEHADPAQAPAFQPCLDRATAVRQEIVNASPNRELPTQAKQVAEGAHPFNALIGLAAASDDRSDEQWLALYREVGTVFGKPVAAAAARKRLRGRQATHCRKSRTA